jgi:hypothetical protein
MKCSENICSITGEKINTEASKGKTVTPTYADTEEGIQGTQIPARC